MDPTPVYDLPIDAQFNFEPDPDLAVEGDEFDDDEDHPTPGWVTTMLGVDPDDLFADDPDE